MEIKLSIKQDDIEQAIRDYVVSKGITTPVQNINFQVSRKGGFALTAEVEVSETPVQPVAETPQAETQDTPPEVNNTTRLEDKPKAKIPAKAKVTKPVPEPVAEEKEPEPAKTEPPFTPDPEEASANDAVEDSTEAEPTKSKSLFG